MEIKGIIVAQLLLDLLLGALVLWCLWRGGNILWMRPSEKVRKAEMEREFQRWQAAARDLIEQMDGRVQALEALAEDLDRAEIRASETLQKLEQVEVGGSPNKDRYGQAMGWIRQGIAIEEVARRTGVGLDELRLMQGLSIQHRAAG